MIYITHLQVLIILICFVNHIPFYKMLLIFILNVIIPVYNDNKSNLVSDSKELEVSFHEWIKKEAKGHHKFQLQSNTSVPFSRDKIGWKTRLTIRKINNLDRNSGTIKWGIFSQQILDSPCMRHLHKKIMPWG